MAPELPLAETLWGASRLARGDAAGAIAKLTAAHAKGPRFADPLELWGEALLAQGDARAAAAKFAEATPLAPHWGRLRLKRAQALAQLGRPDEARAQARWAAALDLTPAERAELAKMSR
jgi:Flp pilus assembly protein TadD